MYKINVDPKVRNEIVLFETIFSNNNRNFTLESIKNQLSSKEINMNTKDIDAYVTTLLHDGLVKENINHYVITN